jgi:hypothetical protein
MRKIPVAAGAEPQPKLGIDWQIQYRRHPAPIFNRTQKPEKESAALWLHRTLKDEPTKPTILALGPLTNINRLLKEHPEDADRIERIVVVESPIKEANESGAVREATRMKVSLDLMSADIDWPMRIDRAQRDDLFAAHSPLTFQVQNLYELWGHETPNLRSSIAIAVVADPRLLKWSDVREQVFEKQHKHIVRAVAGVDTKKLIAHIIRAIKVKQPPSLPAEPKNETRLVERGNFPAKVHVAEDFDTDIEKRWWMSGNAETKDIPPGGVRCLRGVLTQDFDDLQGNMRTSYRAVVFNPVPGPPMGKNTRLAFRYKLQGTDHLRVQLYSLTNGYHRYLSVKGLPQNTWQSGAVDMTEMRRPDGSGGPLSENERIDDIQFYVDPRAQVLIDDVVLCDAAGSEEKRPFPKRILYTAWFDTGKHGKEWLGDFEIVNHEAPRLGKTAKSVPSKDGVWIRLDLKGPRRVTGAVAVDFKHRTTGTGIFQVELRDSRTGRTTMKHVRDFPRDQWTKATVDFGAYHVLQNMLVEGSGPATVDEVRFTAANGATITVDDVLVYEP